MANDEPAPSGVRAATAPGPARVRRRRAAAAIAATVAGAMLAGCGVGNDQSTLDPASSPSHRIAQLWWLMFIGAAVIFAVVVMLMLTAIVRRRGRPDDAPSRTPASSALVVTGGVILPAVVLVALFALAVRAMPSTAAGRPADARLTVQVVGRQWFWEIHYPAHCRRRTARRTAPAARASSPSRLHGHRREATPRAGAPARVHAPRAEPPRLRELPARDLP